MKQAVVTIKYDEEKLNAVKQYMGKKDADFDAELKEVLGKMYEKYVPQAVREYIESRGSSAIVTGTPALFYNYPHRPHPLSSVRLLRMKKVDLTTVFCDKIHFLSFRFAPSRLVKTIPPRNASITIHPSRFKHCTPLISFLYYIYADLLVLIQQILIC